MSPLCVSFLRMPNANYRFIFGVSFVVRFCLIYSPPGRGFRSQINVHEQIELNNFRIGRNLDVRVASD